MNHTTRTFPRTMRGAFGLSAEDATALHFYKIPLYRRFFYALCRWGWLSIFLAVLALAGCDDIADKEADAASLRDALQQAQQERPELWTAERKARADRAVGLVAKGVQ